MTGAAGAQSALYVDLVLPVSNATGTASFVPEKFHPGRVNSSPLPF